VSMTGVVSAGDAIAGGTSSDVPAFWFAGIVSTDVIIRPSGLKLL
jgi:hypothetical protein